MNNTHIKKIFIVSLIFILGVFLFSYITKDNLNIAEVLAEKEPLIENNITKNQNSNNTDVLSTEDTTYINKVYKFKLIYPARWRIQDSSDELLQFYNYPLSEAIEGSVFLERNNKIEIYIGENNVFESSDDYPESTRTETSSKILGQSARRIETILISGDKILGYAFSIHNSNKILNISIYGDTLNFKILDDMIRTIEWI